VRQEGVRKRAGGAGGGQVWRGDSGVRQVVGRKKDLLSRLWVPTHIAYVTFVSVGADGTERVGGCFL